jgi:hypothetical protein
VVIDRNVWQCRIRGAVVIFNGGTLERVKSRVKTRSRRGGIGGCPITGDQRGPAHLSETPTLSRGERWRREGLVVRMCALCGRRIKVGYVDRLIMKHGVLVWKLRGVGR